MTICVIGQGYIGLPTAAMFAQCGETVFGYDVNPHAVAMINQGKIHIEEPELEAVVASVVGKELLQADVKPHAADAYIITVPTPVDHHTHAPDISYVLMAAQDIAPLLKAGDLVILESTSPVGTTQKLHALFSEKRPDIAPTLLLAYCPERVLPGRILQELVQNDRIVGGLTEAATAKAAGLYRLFVKGQILETTAPVAEMVKLTENAFRDVNIAFANELSLVCDHLHLNVWEVIRMANHHPRVNILQPGPGVGGHCIAVDPWFIVDSAPEQSRLIRTAREVNDAKRDVVVQQVLRAAKPDSRILCLGLTFKPDVDDVRESPAMYVAEKICAEHSGTVMIVEPHLDTLPASLQNAAHHMMLTSELVAQADVIVALVKHKEFINYTQHNKKPAATMVDSCGLWA